MSPNQTEYQANSTSATSPNVNAKLNFSIENKGHSSSNKTQYKVVLPEGNFCNSLKMQLVHLMKIQEN